MLPGEHSQEQIGDEGSANRCKGNKFIGKKAFEFQRKNNVSVTKEIKQEGAESYNLYKV